MEKSPEQPKESAYILIQNDYLNTYASIAGLLERGFYKKFQEEIGEKPQVKSFSDRYKHNSFNISDSDKKKIKKLDELSIEANRILNEPNIDITSFLKLAITAAETCDRPDIAEIFKKRIIENKNRLG